MQKERRDGATHCKRSARSSIRHCRRKILIGRARIDVKAQLSASANTDNKLPLIRQDWEADNSVVQPILINLAKNSTRGHVDGNPIKRGPRARLQSAKPQKKERKRQGEKLPGTSSHHLAIRLVSSGSEPEGNGKVRKIRAQKTKGTDLPRCTKA